MDVCPLCLSGDAALLTAVPAREIVDSYRRGFGIDVSRLVRTESVSTFQCYECGLIYHSPLSSGDSLFYEDLCKRPFYYEKDKFEYRHAISFLKDHRPRTVLDFGCGNGRFLSKIKGEFEVKGAEHNRKAVEELIAQDIALDSQDDTYDFIMASQVLEHSHSPRDCLDRITDKLKPGGYLFLSVPNPESPYIKEIFNPLDLPPHHISRWPKRSLEWVAAHYDLKILDYFQEPMRIRHYLELLSHRRRSRTKNVFIRRFGSVFDRLIGMWAIYFIDLKGHTHGAIYRKG